MSDTDHQQLLQENRRLERELGRARALAQVVLEREQTLHQLFESASDVIVTIDEHSQVLSCNSALRKMFGWRQEELQGQPLTLLMPPELREEHLGGVKKFLRSGRRAHPRGLRTHGKHRDGQEFPIEIMLGAVRHPDGTVRFTAMIRDLTGQLASEEQQRKHFNELARLQRLRSVAEMATGLAHELNQPLLAICLQADAAAALLSQEGEENRDLARDSLREIASESQRVSRIIQSVRGMVRRESPVKQELPLQNLIASVLPLCEQFGERSAVKIDFLPSVMDVRVRVEPVQIEQVIVNLMQNAVDALERTDVGQRRIHLSTSTPEGGFVSVAVRDFGEGLPNEPPERLFDSFFTTRPQGIGLGLAICRTIIEDHGGRITAASAPQRGSVFTFTLPVVSG